MCGPGRHGDVARAGAQISGAEVGGDGAVQVDACGKGGVRVIGKQASDMDRPSTDIGAPVCGEGDRLRARLGLGLGLACMHSSMHAWSHECPAEQSSSEVQSSTWQCVSMQTEPATHLRYAGDEGR